MTVTVVVAGAGVRGVTYARHAVVGGARVVAVAEPDSGRRERFAAEFGVRADRAFADWTQLVDAGRIADAAVVTTQDHLHEGPAIALAGLGYHILLEKPMAPTEAGAAAIAYAFGTLRMPRVVSLTVEQNLASRRVMEKLELRKLTEVELPELGLVLWVHARDAVSAANS